MQQTRLLNLLASNARKGEFRAEANTIYLYDMIVSTKAEAKWFGGVDAETFVQTLADMSGDLTLRINSPGGDVFGGRAMAQAIRDYKGKVTAYVDGYAASAASFLTSVADETIMSPGSMLMIHKAWSFEIGNSDEMMATALLLEKIDGTIAETYDAAAKKRGKDGADWMALMAAETWMTGQEAVDLGLADSISEENTKTAKNRWDMAALGMNFGDDVKEPAQPEAEIVIEQPKRPNYAVDMLLRPTA